jgi:probable rRNA maturation factor
MLLKIYFENEQDIMPITYGLKILMRRAIEATLDYEQFCNGCEVSLTFTDNMGIRELNNKFRHIDRETDVLSFPLFDYEGEADEPALDEIRNNLGDIVISLEKAWGQAEEYGHSYEREVAFLAIHSTLHLLGYDHERSAEDDEIQCKRQKEIIEKLYK